MNARKFGLGALLIGLCLAFALPLTALADQERVDNDLVLTGNQNIAAINVPPGTPVAQDAQLAIKYSGGNHLPVGTTVTFVVVPSQTTIPAPYTVTPVSITIPAGWGTTVTEVSGWSHISFNAPTVTTLTALTVKYLETVSYGNKLTGAAAFVFNVAANADTTPPVITVPSAAGAEATSPAGAAVSYSATTDDGSPVTCVPPSGSTFPLGATTVTCTATDAAGNTATTKFVVTVSDTIAPTITATAAPAGWTNGDVVVTFACSDSGSGIASCPAPVTATAEGVYEVSGTATDNAGNSASASATVKIDKTVPVVSITGPAIVIQGQAASATVTASDALSGLAVNPSGALALDTSAPGSRTVTVTATDNAGNSSSATLTYMVWTLNCEAPPVFKNGAGVGQFNAGSTIPVKCRITDGTNVISTATGSVSIGTASAPLRYDATEQRYIATVKTATGSYAVIVTIDGVGSVQVATVTTR